MRLLVWFLVLLNVALLVYFNLETLFPAPKVVHQEVNPEKLKLLMDEDFAKLNPKTYSAAAAATAADSCYKWGQFSDSNLAEAQAFVEQLGLEASLVQDTSAAQNKRFWVYYPPLPTPEKAQAKAQEIRNLGVDELYIVQGKKWKNAISFGLFSEEQLATNLLKNLKAKGVRNAVKSLRSQTNNTTSLIASNVTSEQAVQLYQIRPAFVGTDVTPVPCP